MDYKEWFEKYGNYQAEGFYGVDPKIEDQYQAFKSRLMDEVRDDLEAEITRNVVNGLRGQG